LGVAESHPMAIGGGSATPKAQTDKKKKKKESLAIGGSQITLASLGMALATLDRLLWGGLL
jgi:hypothetical protein